MNELLLFTLMLCHDVGLTEKKCMEWHSRCVLNIKSSKYPPTNPSDFCSKVLSNKVWDNIKVKAKECI